MNRRIIILAAATATALLPFTSTTATAVVDPRPPATSWLLECNTRSSLVEPEIQPWLHAWAAIDATGKTLWTNHIIVNGKDIDPKLASVEVTATPLSEGILVELNADFNENGPDTPNEHCFDSKVVGR